MIESKEREQLQECAALYLQEYAGSQDVYGWMAKHGIGESDYGRWLDALGRKESVFHHRLFGHHPIYDFPLFEPEKIPDFIEHVWISDGFTKQGLPIIPGDFLKDTRILEYCSQRTLEWNFVNGFDLLSGTLAIYAGYKNCKLYFGQEASIDTLTDFAKQVGIGTLEMALAIARTNPFLLFGAVLYLAGTLKGLMNDSSVVYFKKITSRYYVIVMDPTLSLQKVVESYYLKVPEAEKALKAKVEGYYLKK